MSLNWTYTTSLSGGNQLYQLNATVTAGSSVSVSEVIPDASTDLDVLFAIPNASASNSAKALGLFANQALTVKVCLADNTVLQTIALAANVPYLWAEGVTDPAWRNGGNIAKLRVTNASGAATTLYADALFDPTV